MLSRINGWNDNVKSTVRCTFLSFIYYIQNYINPVYYFVHIFGNSKKIAMSSENVQSHQQQNVEDVDLSQTLPVFPKLSKPCVNVWMEKMNKGVLSCAHFKEHWRIWVPKIYTPGPLNCLEWNFDEEEAQKILFNTLEEFICNGDPKVVLKQLSQMDNIMCGKVFKSGDPTYSCRECGMDLTCVLCVDCFKHSVHRNHKYKMGSSSGGGCCDCGDVEAWKKEPFCKIHLAGAQAKESRGNKLPADIAERAAITFEAVLKYCYELLSLEHTPGLPPDLCVKEFDEGPLMHSSTADTYCTVLYNDEAHTFDQVISILTTVLKCHQREAMEYVTSVDREGRAVLKCSHFPFCVELKSDIEMHTSRRSNGPLKVLVVHAHVIAHQTFAMKLLNWLQQFISVCESFRVLFSNVALNTKLLEISIVEGILMRDSQLWKSARTAWHRLFISGMLMEYESKKALAIVFTYNYGAVMKDFIRDDHDHSFSIVSLSVQLFTVPTLAHYLIAHHDVLFILLNTFISESSRRCNAAGKLELDSNTPNPSFKRAQFILYDLRYLLSTRPEVLTDELRKGFLQGISLLLTLFASMQCMDAVVRQVGQHTEYEPEWGSAFNLHTRLSPVISLALDWCGSDRIVLIKAVRLVLRKLYEQPGTDNGVGQVRELANHSATCIQYDVSSEPVSIHLPLSRFLAGLFLHLEKHNLHFQCAEFSNQTKPTPEQIIEPVLRIQAMISQVYAGMWRRNGYSLLNQLYFYHNVKCRSEMLDRDIILLQAGASLIESNEFLIHVLNKYNLLPWASSDYETNFLKNTEEENIRQKINLVEEFLGLLITIIGERHVPGVGQVTSDDHLKKEIIQQLCINSLSHSELNKRLLDDSHLLFSEMERVIQDIAVFKKPSQTSGEKGVYELKPAFYSEYNVFFYHYTKEELSKAEETQRKRRKALGELECCPPPKLPKLTEVFSLVANLLQCDVMLHIMETVLERALNLRARSFSELQVHKILYLIGFALQEQESGHYPFLAFPERAAKWKIYKLLEELSSSPRIEAHKDLLTWVLEKYRAVAGTTITEDTNVSATTHTEKSSDTVFNKNDKEWRTKMVAQKRAKIMAQMAAMQKHFMNKNAELFKEATLDVNKSNHPGSTMDLSECCQKSPVAIGVNQTLRIPEEKTYTCILCQDNQAVTATGLAMVLVAFVQKSTVLCQYKADPEEPDLLYLSAKLGASPHTSTCGHVMHIHCFREYFENVYVKENRRPYRLRHPAGFDIEKHEYLCPLCECLGNAVLPLLPALGSLQPSTQTEHDLNFGTWLEALWLTVGCKSNGKLYKTHSMKDSYDSGNQDYVVAKSEDVIGEDNPLENGTSVCPAKAVYEELGNTAAVFESIYGQAGPNLSESIKSMVHTFTRAISAAALDSEPHARDTRIPLLTWKSTAYTVHAIEFLLRDMGEPLLGALPSRQRSSLEGLSKISAILGSTCMIGQTSESTWAIKDTIGSYALSLLTILLNNPSSGPSVLDWDPFGVLIPLINSLPSLFHTNPDTQPPIITSGICESYALRVVFLSLIVKILLTSDFYDSMDVENNQEIVGSTSSESIMTLVQSLGININNLTAPELGRRVKDACLPFLRCCALYFHYVSDVPAPEELTKQDGDTYENICSYLGLPVTFDELIVPDFDIIMKLVNIWKNHPTVQKYMFDASSVVIIKEPLKVNKLMDLPDDYSELMNMTSSFTCPNSDRQDSRNPTMCLVCGKMLCSQSYCCQTEFEQILVGACIYHANKCGAGIGVFLRVRDCELLFLRYPNRGSFFASPYLDEYGETDQGLRRGNPLRLCHYKYKQLNRMWLRHGLYESIARATETSSNLISMQWQHL